MKIKAAQIARDLGLSKATVSLALNDKPGVSEETKKMIFQYIDRMEKGIDIVENNIIKIVNYSKKENIYGGEVDLWSEVLSEFNKEAKKDGYSLGIDYINDDIDEINKLIMECNQGHVVGAIVFANDLDEDIFKLFKQIKKPLIIYDNDFDDDNYSYVMIDNYQGMEKIIKLIVEKGFNEVCYLANSHDNYNFRKRRMAFTDLISKYNLTGRIFITGNDVESVYEAMKTELVDKSFPKVLISENYQVSIGTIKAIQEMNLSFKDDINLIGIDEIPDYFCYGHHLTALKIIHGKRAGVALSLLKKEIEDHDVEKFKIYSTCRLIEGDTI
ncbi:MAG TPA: LacI family transcriptional regulator [Candidatus Erysipelatoclostridium merdavium]|uniref:LacI family transcriptional regulator n=1 Tax=Candidatus Erysipelatoclostridium merdavium TaxID=2838566 RepID=A0A9D1XP60_9FIRM|nr:LacI family DNA-binding transcriptional regulator [Erysipelatoclostridium sp. An15]HIX82801.1 LacI family transcriptional regulator [Candidatus Erysipelatoclostridium merdavium]